MFLAGSRQCPGSGQISGKPWVTVPHFAASSCRKEKVMRGLIIIAVLSGSVCLAAETQLQKGNRQYDTAQQITNVNLKTYDCLVSNLDATHGKCKLTFEKGDQALNFTASAEVAAPWAISSKYSNLVFSGLTITVSKVGEVLTIEDGTGNVISKKIDFSR
jgi:hypothetical protein